MGWLLMEPDTAAWAKPASKTASTAKAKAASQPQPAAAANESSSPSDKPTLAIRFGNQGDLVRIAFDWSERVGGYSATMVGGTLRVEFDQKGRVDMAGDGVLPADFGRPAASNAGEGSLFVMTVPPGINFSHYRAGSKVVVELRNPNGRPFAKPPENKPAPADAEKAGAEKKTVEQLQLEKAEQQRQEAVAAKAKEAKSVEARAAYADKLIKEAEEKAARDEAASKTAKANKEAVKNADAAQKPGQKPGQASQDSDASTVSEPPAVSPVASDGGVKEKAGQPTQAEKSASPSKTKVMVSQDDQAAMASVQVPDVMAGEALAPDAAASLKQAKSLQDKAKAGALTTAKALTAKERAALSKNAVASNPVTDSTPPPTTLSSGNPPARGKQASTASSNSENLDAPVKPKGDIVIQRQVVAKGLIMTFPFTEKVAVAAYQRAGRYNLVFSQPYAIAAPNFGEAERPFITNVSNHLVPGGSLLQMQLADGISPFLLLDGYRWIVTLRTQPSPLDHEAVVNVIADGTGEPKASVTLMGADRLLSVRDASVGDVLKVLPTVKSGAGVTNTQQFPEFRLLATDQGVVVDPLADRLIIGQDGDTVTITSDAGLYLSRNMVANLPNAANRAAAMPNAADKSLPPNKLLDFASWQQLANGQSFSEARHGLEANVIAEGVDKNVARLTLAQFYLANAMSAEAMALLQLIEQDDPTFFGRRDVAAAALVTLIMERRLPEAERLLGFPQLINEGEAKLWLGLLR
ncbi:MAG: hypothetical protein FJX22_00200, partial [Alphaproteobacteria bacterium]|nr:hypothetical protein [Alphaproteobacteria bacterium]